MPRWNVQLLDAAAEELGELPDDMQARFLRIAELLEAYGPFEVGRPHVAPLGNGLWGIRIKGRSGIARALFEIRTGRQLAVGRVFTKKTRKMPPREIRLAVQRLKEADMAKRLSDVRDVLLAKPGVRAAYDELRDEFELADALIRARIRAGLTQSVVAERMRTSQAAVARLESGRQSPSYRSLQKYAQAIGARLKIELVP